MSSTNDSSRPSSGDRPAARDYSSPSPLEAKFYYAGLPSAPVLVARTGTTPWEAPKGPEAYRKLKELRAVGIHILNDVWEDKLAPKVHDLLNSRNVKWTSTDVVRIGNAGDPFFPIILWIGVLPESLSGGDGIVVACKCKDLLEEHGIADLDVEIRESVVTRMTRSVGPKLLNSIDDDSHPTVDLRDSLTTTLGLPICAQATPWAEGTGGFFIGEGTGSKRLLLVTARHVIFKPDKHNNKMFKRKNDSQPRYNVILLGDMAFKRFLESIQSEVEDKRDIVDRQKERIMLFGVQDDPETNNKRRKAQALLDEAREAMDELNVFYKDVSTHWATQESRVLGHVIFSPPIGVGVGPQTYTEDFAIIEIDKSKIDASNFIGNVIDLGTEIPPKKFRKKMYPNLQNKPEFKFKYPADRLLRIRGTIPDKETRHLPMVDQNGEPCLMVIKRGIATNVTIGRANNIRSFTRTYFDDDDENPMTSKEWPILPYDNRSGPFSDDGDSGSAVVDGRGRIGGLLTGGAGLTGSTDVTYVTPISFLLDRINHYGFRRANVNPVLALDALTDGH